MYMLNETRQLIIYLLVLSITSGCTASKNLVNNEEYKSFTNQCYQTTKDSFIFSLGFCTGNESDCASIQAYGAQKKASAKNRKIPNSQSELESAPKFWNERIRIASLAGNTEYIKSIKAGSKFEVIGLYHETHGTLGTFWYVQVRLEGTGKVIELPSLYHLLQPSWLNKDNTLSFDNRFVKHCTNAIDKS